MRKEKIKNVIEITEALVKELRTLECDIKERKLIEALWCLHDASNNVLELIKEKERDEELTVILY